MSSENHGPGAPEVPSIQVPVPPTQPQPLRLWPWWVGPPNPFYLLSAACVIHSTGLSVSGAVKDLPPLVTSSLIAGYLLLLAVVGVVVVKLWKVWDDARSILLTLLLLMLELTLSFDKLLLDSPHFWGVMVLLLAGACIGLSEMIIRLLRLNLPAIYRVPFYLQLWLMVVAGAAPANLMRTLTEEQVRWLIVAVSPLWAVMVLSLLPAVRAGAEAVRMRHVPWIWPYYPWSLFVILWLCLGFRVWTLSLSFDAATSLSLEAAMQLQNSFLGPFIFVPPLMAMAVLALEAAIVRGALISRIFASALPAVCAGLAMWSLRGNPAAAEFLNRMTSAIGSPAWLAVWLALGVSALGAMRGVAECQRMAVIYLGLLAVVDARTLSVPAGVLVQPWPLWVISAAFLAIGTVSRRSHVFLEGALWGVAASVASQWLSVWPFSQTLLIGHLCVAAVMMSGLVGKDDFALVLRSAGVFFSLLALPVGLEKSLRPEWSWWVPIVYLVLSAIPLGIIGVVNRWPGYRWSATTLAVGAYLTAYIEAGQYLHSTVHWRGAGTFLSGLVLLHVAVGVSAVKGRLTSTAVANSKDPSIPEHA